jgi:chorismate mutase
MNLPYLRAKLDRLNEQIVSRIKDRSRFAINEAVYRPGAIPIRNQSSISLMEWALEGMERYHATLGRYELPDQLPLRNDVVTASPVQRRVDMPLLPVITPPPRDELFRFYTTLLPEFCKPGDDPQNYGETAYADADVLVRVNERIYLGAFVARSKVERVPEIIRLSDDPSAIREKFRDREREAIVLERAAQAAWRYMINPDVIEKVFRWMIEQTIDLEVRYVQQMARL